VYEGDNGHTRRVCVRVQSVSLGYKQAHMVRVRHVMSEYDEDTDDYDECTCELNCPSEVGAKAGDGPNDFVVCGCVTVELAEQCYCCGNLFCSSCLHYVISGRFTWNVCHYCDTNPDCLISKHMAAPTCDSTDCLFQSYVYESECAALLIHSDPRCKCGMRTAIANGPVCCLCVSSEDK